MWQDSLPENGMERRQEGNGEVVAGRMLSTARLTAVGTLPKDWWGRELKVSGLSNSRQVAKQNKNSCFFPPGSA